MSIRGLLVDPSSNSCNNHNENCTAERKENYKWGLCSGLVKYSG